MPYQVVDGAQLQCSFGTSPSQLGVLPVNRTRDDGFWSATIQDHVPMVNIRPFGMCISPSNPQVAAATAAALGVLTPQPCIPNTATPWAPGAIRTKIQDIPALDDCSTCNCMWGGLIAVLSPGQAKTQIL